MPDPRGSEGSQPGLQTVAGPPRGKREGSAEEARAAGSSVPGFTEQVTPKVYKMREGKLPTTSGWTWFMKEAGTLKSPGVDEPPRLGRDGQDGQQLPASLLFATAFKPGPMQRKAICPQPITRDVSFLISPLPAPQSGCTQGLAFVLLEAPQHSACHPALSIHPAFQPSSHLSIHPAISPSMPVMGVTPCPGQL